ncbi:signal recognition particle-docking protein FtsY [Terrihabitans sp. B22-R8]|uniref:signal recognition particle-docking protein FtsY n=1 Tax=Terrihabitans sp. B22-R8 TaxID=3425128 RepID=UPI00403C22B9
MSEPEQPKRGFLSRLLGIPVKPEPDPEPQADERLGGLTPEPPAVVATQPEVPPALDIPDLVVQPLPRSTDEDAAATEEELPDIEPDAAPVPELPVEVDVSAVPEDAALSPFVAPSSEPPPVGTPGPGWFTRLRQGLQRTSDRLGTGISDLFTKSRFDAGTLDDLEDLLIQADLGMDTAIRITQEVGRQRHERGLDAHGVRGVVASEVEKALQAVAKPLVVDGAEKPFVILMVGVNGSGKTTTIGKLTQKFRDEGRSVWLAAGDTFRAAAVDQLRVWAERTGVPIVTKDVGADSAGLAFEALEKARAANADVLLVDTAGRLQNRAELMNELEKVIRVLKKQDATAPHAVLLVLDATVGQNALSQVEAFRKTAGVTGLVMTKLDGTARGGILVAVAEKFGLPIHFIGVGESVGDLEPFDPRDFARALVGLDK